ncbi:Polyphosphate kinase 2 (PPK2) [Anatilimnocola aggregata]|uniref:Polyphosphate kinase 2 (PPK2) n=1 Tax=Anatilimnocola aggregata TaxID=2528021 RepID=A0A517YIP7_9BACT|nr:polyphosphate kinase 2 family protein [Anatilimnocola aggregata]QDU30084.1 Polyphosphate kinase 2 (PPK2) [Anatilimnocola aggregata]
MTDRNKLIEKFRVSPGKKFDLADHDPDWSGDKDVAVEKRKEYAKESLTLDVSELAEAQEMLYADNSWSLLVIFQAMDAAGKDSTIKHVMSGINPQGCQVYSFKHPSAEELDHDFLWRCNRALPERGRIGIFNRSYYEEVLIVRVHPELIGAQRIPGVQPGEALKKEFWEHRYEDINSFERHLTRNGTTIVKFFLNISKKEQRKRFLKRIDEPEKHWKFAASDLHERNYWDDYMRAYEDCLSATSTEHAPWYVIPADHKWVTRAAVAAILNQTIRGLGLKWPQISPAQAAEIAKAREELKGE